jgi:hypothetical protein
MAVNQAGLYAAEDAVSGHILFPGNVLFSGNWCFTMPGELQEDRCEIIGTQGKIKFPVFGNRFEVCNTSGVRSFDFVQPEHIQQPMIGKVVDYFLGRGVNPCSAGEALKSLSVMESFLQRD